MRVTRVGDQVDLAVTNHGRGIAPADIPTIFDRCVRTREARARRTRGAGLGLCIARALVEAQGGRLSVESVVDDTTRFHATFPRVP
jgi:signal transduction histidine kinase